MDRSCFVFIPCLLIISRGFAQWPPFPIPGANSSATSPNPADFLKKGAETAKATKTNTFESGQTVIGGQVANMPGSANYSKQLGSVQCKGADKAVPGVSFVSATVGQGTDFNGQFLCETTCGGQCLPSGTVGSKESPISGNNFDCKCPKERCNPTPMTMGMGADSKSPMKDLYQVKCAYEGKCACKGMQDPPDVYRMGYVCKPDGNLNHTDEDANKAKNSFVRWCACCPMSM